MSIVSRIYREGFTLVHLRDGIPVIDRLQCMLFALFAGVLSGIGAMLVFGMLSGKWSLTSFLLVGVSAGLIGTTASVFRNLRTIDASRRKKNS